MRLFTPKDFEWHLTSEGASERANAVFSDWLSKQETVYYINQFPHLIVREGGKRCEALETHKAKIVCIEKLVKPDQPCNHSSEIRIDTRSNSESIYYCNKCGVELKTPVWEAK